MRALFAIRQGDGRLSSKEVKSKSVCVIEGLNYSIAQPRYEIFANAFDYTRVRSDFYGVFSHRESHYLQSVFVRKFAPLKSKTSVRGVVVRHCNLPAALDRAAKRRCRLVEEGPARKLVCELARLNS
jgi:hypothetical protein